MLRLWINKIPRFLGYYGAGFLAICIFIVGFRELYSSNTYPSMIWKEISGTDLEVEIPLLDFSVMYFLIWALRTGSGLESERKLGEN